MCSRIGVNEYAIATPPTDNDEIMNANKRSRFLYIPEIHDFSFELFILMSGDELPLLKIWLMILVSIRINIIKNPANPNSGKQEKMSKLLKFMLVMKPKPVTIVIKVDVKKEPIMLLVFKYPRL